MQRPTLLTDSLNGWSNGIFSVQSSATVRHPITQSEVALAYALYAKQAGPSKLYRHRHTKM